MRTNKKIFTIFIGCALIVSGLFFSAETARAKGVVNVIVSSFGGFVDPVLNAIIDYNSCDINVLWGCSSGGPPGGGPPGGGSCGGGGGYSCSSYSDQQTVNVYSSASCRTGQWWCDNHFGGNLGGNWNCLSVSGGSCSSDAPQGSNVTCGRCGSGGGGGGGGTTGPGGGGGGGGGGGPTGPGGGGGGGGNPPCGNGSCSGGENCYSCSADCGQCLPIQTITVCSGAFCSGSASCDPNIQSCSNQCGSKYDCGYVDPQVVIQPIQDVVVPDSLRVSWNSSYTSSCSASSNPNIWSGSKSTSGSEDIFNPTSISNRGTYSLSISCSGVFGDGAWAYDSKTAKIISLPRCSFSADPSTIVLPEESTLSWSCAYVSGGASGGCSIDNGAGSVNSISGSMNVVPSKTTTYTLTCNGLDGSRSWQATVTNAFESTIKEVIPR